MWARASSPVQERQWPRANLFFQRPATWQNTLIAPLGEVRACDGLRWLLLLFFHVRSTAPAQSLAGLAALLH